MTPIPMGVRSSEFTCTWTGSGASVGAWVCDAPKACDLTVMDKVHWPTEGAPYPAKRAGYGKVTVMTSGNLEFTLSLGQILPPLCTGNLYHNLSR